MPGYSMRKEDLDARLARIEGQVRGIRRMLAEDTGRPRYATATTCHGCLNPGRVEVPR